MLVTETDTLYLEHYSDMAEAIDCIHDDSLLQTRGGYSGEPQSISIASSTDWDNGVGFEGAKRLFYEGWPEGLERADKFRAALDDIVGAQHIAERLEHSTEGPCVDPGAYAEGLPECMVHFVPEARAGAGKVLDVLVNIAASVSVKSDSIMRRGAAVLCLVDALEMHGYNLAITSYWPACGYRKSAAWSMTIKRLDSPLDADLTAFLIAHPASNRRLGFRLAELFPARIREQTGITRHENYGQPDPVREIEARYDISCPPLRYSDSDSTFESDAAAAAWINGYIEKFGVTVSA